jgi:hypothetical protein
VSAVLILIGGFVLYEIVTQGQQINALLARMGAGATAVSGSTAVAPPSFSAVAPSSSGSLTEAAAATSAVSIGLNFIPVAGPAISAVFNAIAGNLLKASAKRAAEAKNENSAVANAVPGWDAAVAQIVAAYNSGQVSATEASSLFDLALQNYWNETVPQIQPGRNGCNGGKSCPAPSSVTNEGGNNYCSGDIGAACCVGCADLDLSTHNLKAAVAAQAATGKPQTGFVQVVYASKYGGINRPAYNVTFT